MKALIQAVALAAAIAVPAISFAQSDQPLTARRSAPNSCNSKAGYDPSSDQTQYPKNILAAEQRVAAQNGATSGYGGVAEGSSAAGAGSIATPGFPARPDFQRP